MRRRQGQEKKLRTKMPPLFLDVSNNNYYFIRGAKVDVRVCVMKCKYYHTTNFKFQIRTRCTGCLRYLTRFFRLF